MAPAARDRLTTVLDHLLSTTSEIVNEMEDVDRLLQNQPLQGGVNGYECPRPACPSPGTKPKQINKELLGLIK